MGNKRSIKLYSISTIIMLILVWLSLTAILFSDSKAALEMTPTTGAIWTSDPHGERVNGNLYKNPRKVYLAGGPHRIGSAALPDGVYYFQVTDPASKQLLSNDDIADRRFTVENSYITSSSPGTHDENDDTTRGIGVAIIIFVTINDEQSFFVYHTLSVY